jgi:hypothetical protein
VPPHLNKWEDEMKIYVAGPYTKGDVAINVHNAIMAAEELVRKGHTPYIPHLTHFWHLVCPHEIEFWYNYDLTWLKYCDAIVRLPGESTGADKEVELARVWGLRVFDATESVPYVG